MQRISKKTLIFLFFLSLSFWAFALPGVRNYLPDVSGEYVYYRDLTFKSDAHIGFIFYDDSTYAARFYSAKDAKNKSLEKDITLYVTVNAEKDSLELTGERIIGDESSEDKDIINYIHDLLYEFTSYRKKIDISSNEKVVIRDDFPLFGGKCEILYSALIPIFNVEEIKSADGKALFSVEATGRLSSSNDTSFTDFKGYEKLPKDKKRKVKRAKESEMTAEAGRQTITLSTLWEQSMANVWVLGEEAIILMTEIDTPENMPSKIAKDSLIRRLRQSTEGSYSLWQYGKIVESEKQTEITNLFFQDETESLTRDFKILTSKDEEGFFLLTLTVFESVYQKERAYFEKILSSYKIN